MNYLSSVKHVPKLIDQIKVEKDHRIIIMEQKGRSLEQLKRSSSGTKLSLGLVLHLAVILLQALNQIHDKGILHRDLKPENILIGELGDPGLYLIDFGLAKLYKNLQTGEHIKLRDGKKLTGTARYASLNNFKGFEQSRRDELESLAHVLIYLLKGSLPWQTVEAATKDEKWRKTLECMENTTFESLCEGMPKEF